MSKHLRHLHETAQYRLKICGEIADSIANGLVALNTRRENSELIKRMLKLEAEGLEVTQEIRQFIIQSCTKDKYEHWRAIFAVLEEILPNLRLLFSSNRNLPWIVKVNP